MMKLREMYRQLSRGKKLILTDAANKVSGLPKVASATGQIYVDYDEVMRILEGGDIIER